MKIEILGTGCHDCLRLEMLLGEVLSELGRTDAQVILVENERAIRRFMPLEAVPGLVIEGRLICTSEVPDRRTLREWLAEAAEPRS